MLGAWRTGAAQLFHDGREREPFRDFQTLGQTTPQLRARDVEDRDIVFVLDLVGRLVLRAVLHVHHVLKVDHFDAHLFLMLAKQILRIIGPVKILTLRVRTGARMIATHDEMRAAVVFADQTVPNRLARASHAHRKVQKAH